jgi:hypothetical protein
MDTQGRQEPQWWFKRQGTGLCEKAGHEPEASTARRRQQARLFLCKDDWNEEKTHIRENGERPKLTD